MSAKSFAGLSMPSAVSQIAERVAIDLQTWMRQHRSLGSS
jgi:hypothetical protein